MIAHKRILNTRQKAANRALKRMFQRMAQDIKALINRYAAFDGTLPMDTMRPIRTQSAVIVMDYFVGQDGRNAYDAQNRPLAPYPDIMNTQLAIVRGDVVLAHQKWLEQNAPLDIRIWLQNGIAPVLEQQSTRPFLQYEHSHEWVDTRGYTLSDRIWQAGTETRRKLDLLLADGIRNGKSAVSLSKLVDQFLIPGRNAIRTKKPYGSDGSYDALRLMRSEITLAHSRAALVSAGMNPFVVSMNYNLSPQHPRADICDPLAAASPYPVAECPVPVQDTHPHCMCHVAPNTGDMQSIIDQLRLDISNGETAYTNPANAYAFLRLLLGAWLFETFLRHEAFSMERLA